ncbi:hypothetical protein AB0G48_18320 [Streptomyces rubiginosohelvolus]|uniref:hypothetical protein n=1 Tax=Streptomyces rubiginosohelvolus TaxID=67362 RepID=UPI0033CF6407
MNLNTTPTDPSTQTHSRCFTRSGEYARIEGAGGLNGHYTQDLATISTGHRVGLHDAHLGRSVIGTVREARHETDSTTFLFEADGFRVLHGTEPVMTDWRTYRWQSATTAGHVHAVVHPTSTASAPYTHRYSPVPGVSLAFVDVTGHGGPGGEWLYGTPYREDLGDLVPWCQHCGQPMTAPSSPGETAPYFDVADGDPSPPCCGGRTHHPVYIWTPRDHACATPCQDIRLANDYRVRDGQPLLDAFDVVHADTAPAFPMSSTAEWLDSALNGPEFVDDIMQNAVVRPAENLWWEEEATDGMADWPR